MLQPSVIQFFSEWNGPYCWSWSWTTIQLTITYV